MPISDLWNCCIPIGKPGVPWWWPYILVSDAAQFKEDLDPLCESIVVSLTLHLQWTLKKEKNPLSKTLFEMTQDLEEGNLMLKTEAFLSYVVLSSWRDFILVLKSCVKLSPWAENLQIVRWCSESIVWKGCANPKGIRWSYTGRTAKISSPQWNNNVKDSSPSRNNQQVPNDWWFEDVSILRIYHFVRVITAMKYSSLMLGADKYSLKSYIGPAKGKRMVYNSQP